jgi:hypothetical protein
MTSTEPLATPEDVADTWRPLTPAETGRVMSLIEKASAKLRHECPFDIDERVGLFSTDPTAPTALDPLVVADVVATIVKRFLANPEGFASTSEGDGPFSRSGTFVNRYDKSGSDVRGAIQVTPSDIAQLRPAVPTVVARSFRVNVPAPQILLTRGLGSRDGALGPVVIPDVFPGREVE